MLGYFFSTVLDWGGAPCPGFDGARNDCWILLLVRKSSFVAENKFLLKFVEPTSDCVAIKSVADASFWNNELVETSDWGVTGVNLAGVCKSKRILDTLFN